MLTLRSTPKLGMALSNGSAGRARANFLSFHCNILLGDNQVERSPPYSCHTFSLGFCPTLLGYRPRELAGIARFHFLACANADDADDFWAFLSCDVHATSDGVSVGAFDGGIVGGRVGVNVECGGHPSEMSVPKLKQAVSKAAIELDICCPLATLLSGSVLRCSGGKLESVLGCRLERTTVDRLVGLCCQI